MALALTEKPLLLFLRNHLQSYMSFFAQTDATPQTLVAGLRALVQEMLYNATIDPRYRPLLLESCEMIPHLGQDTLAQYLTAHDLPPARFLGEAAERFDSALVPLQHETQGSGYVLYLTHTLTTWQVYTLLAHAYGHLAYGHVRRGDTHSHYDRLDDLQSSFGPARRWDRDIQEQQSLWFQAPAHITSLLADLEHEWTFPSFAQAFERLRSEDCDEATLGLRAFAARHGREFIALDFDLERDAQLFPHQRRGAAELVVRLHKLGVALLADSVGLGKTRTVAATIRLLCQAGLITRAAILAPAKLHHNWQAELEMLHLTVSTQAELPGNVLLLNKDKFKRFTPTQARRAIQSCQLLVVEEAHQDLRNFGNKFHRNLREAALSTYGLLVTATPWNNRRGDIFAMLYPFASNRMGSDRPSNLFDCFARGFKEGQELFEQDNALFQQLYDRTTLQRTRRQLRETGDTSVFYAPRRPYLVSVPYTPEQRRGFATLLARIEQLRLPSYNPVRHLTSVDSSENRLSGIHRFQLLKRAESSMYAFQTSLQRLAVKAQALQEELAALDDSEAAIAHWLHQWYRHKEVEDASEQEPEQGASEPRLRPDRQGRLYKLINEAARDGKLRALRRLLLADCQQDVQRIQAIQHDFAPLFAHDPKVEVIVQEMQQYVARGSKVLCISADTDTAFAVYRAALAHPLLRQQGIGFVTSSEKDEYAATQINGQKAKREAVLSRFAPRSWSTAGVKGHAKADQQAYPQALAVLIGSDTLSVGQNLQDARVLFNLDLCWNPMQHEQRIGRIDRPRHKDDAAPLDIYYFLNLDLIEAELSLRQTLEQRLTSTYQDTAFDDVIFPGYFDMIEQFRRLRQEKGNDHAYIAEADALLEEIAECSARPSTDAAAESERESVALHHLLELARNLAPAEDATRKTQLVNIGRVPHVDWQGTPLLIRPDAALIAEVRFQPQDQQERPLGKEAYQHVYVSLYENALEGPRLDLDDTSLVAVVEGLLAETSHIPLKQSHISQLQALLEKLEEYVRQAQASQLNLYRRQARYLREANADHNEGRLVQHIEAALINVRFLV